MNYRYYQIWRNKFLTTDAITIDHMIESLASALHLLREMRDRGVTLDGGASDDYAYLVTTDVKVAERFSFDIEDSWMEDDDNFDDDNFDDNFDDDDDFEDISLAEQVARECGLEVIEP